jgi:hypothetical protein
VIGDRKWESWCTFLSGLLKLLYLRTLSISDAQLNDHSEDGLLERCGLRLWGSCHVSAACSIISFYLFPLEPSLVCTHRGWMIFAAPSHSISIQSAIPTHNAMKRSFSPFHLVARQVDQADGILTSILIHLYIELSAEE